MSCCYSRGKLLIHPAKENQPTTVMTNFTASGENFTSNQTGTGVFVFLSAVNLFLSVTASLGNALILVALCKESSLYPPTKLLFRCLAVTDLCVGLISQPLFSLSLMSSVTKGINRRVIYFVDKVYYASSFTLCGVSVFTSTAISVDRLLALLLGLLYRHVVTLRRVGVVLISFWLIGVSWGLISIWKSRIAFSVDFSFTIIAIATSILAYIKIYRRLRHHQLQVNVPQSQLNRRGTPLNTARFKKTVSNVLWVQFALIVCYMPFIVVVTLSTFGQVHGTAFQIAFSFTATLTYLNSSLNPVLYCWKIGTVRQAAKNTIKQLNCCKSAEIVQ